MHSYDETPPPLCIIILGACHRTTPGCRPARPLTTVRTPWRPFDAKKPVHSADKPRRKARIRKPQAPAVAVLGIQCDQDQ